MQKVALLYNPDSGGSKKRQKEMEAALAILQGDGVDAALIATETPVHAAEEARRAIDSGCDTIFACGGDGTIHNIVQVVATTQVALGILPIGTANALAHDLRIPRKVTAAARSALSGAPRRVALGHVKYVDLKGNPGSRYFVIAAGIGVDAHLFYKLQTATKQRLGMNAYYAKAWQMWFSYPMPRFVAEYLATGESTRKSAEVTELISVRIRNFGGVVQQLAPGASLDRDDMRLVFCRTGSRLAFLAYVMRCLVWCPLKIPGIDLAYGTSVSCRYQTPTPEKGRPKIYVEADGELLGTLPVEMRVVPDALTILAPSR